MLKREQIDATDILTVVAELPIPGSLDDIANRLLRPIPRRTLQRRLAQLVGSGRLTALSDRGGRRYHVETSMPMGVAETASPASLDRDEISLSPEAAEIKRRVTRPLSGRRPVGYQTSFLEDYVPNVSAYLSPALRRKLSTLGQTNHETLPAGTYFRKVMDRLLIDLSWNSSRLEGNTYSLLETQRLLKLGEAAPGKGAEEAQMILNHKQAIELLVAQAEEIGFNRYTLCNLHALLADNLLPDPAACGRIRSHAVAITGTVFHPLEVPQVIKAHFEQIMKKATAIEDAFEQAFFVMVHLPYLQPFDDVNKRVSRLAANIPLVTRNLSPLSFVDVPRSDYVNATLGVYELNRVEYLRDVFVWAYERSCARYAAVRQSLGAPDLFRLRHRQRLIEVVGTVVRRGMDKAAAASFVRKEAETLSNAEDRPRFAAHAETELSSLHEGNFARFQIRPAEFATWLRNWQ